MTSKGGLKALAKTFVCDTSKPTHSRSYYLLQHINRIDFTKIVPLVFLGTVCGRPLNALMKIKYKLLLRKLITSHSKNGFFLSIINLSGFYVHLDLLINAEIGFFIKDSCSRVLQTNMYMTHNKKHELS